MPDDLGGYAAGGEIVHAAAIARPGDEAPDNELHIGESRAFGAMKEKAPPVRAGLSSARDVRGG
jgi:hypothetical protein